MRLVNKRVLESLIKCGALDSTGWKRAQLLVVIERAVELALARQRDKANGQLGLFGEEQMEAAEELIPPPMEELPKAQILAMEKEMTGFFVTGHPLDAYRAELRGMLQIGQILSGECTDNQRVNIAGIVTAAKRLPTKNGETMCFATVEDFTGAVEVVVFPRTFERFGPLLVMDRPVSVAGRLSVSDDKSKVIAESVKALGQVTTREVRVRRIRKDQETPAVFELLKQTFSEFHGQTTVYLQLLDQKRLIKTDTAFWINPSSAAIERIEDILGPGSVFFGIILASGL